MSADLDDWFNMAKTPEAAPEKPCEAPKTVKKPSEVPTIKGVEKGELGVVVSKTKKEIVVQTTMRVSCTLHGSLKGQEDTIKVGSKVLVEAHRQKVSLRPDNSITNISGGDEMGIKVVFRIMAVVPDDYTPKKEEIFVVLDDALDWLLEAPAAAGGK